MSSVNDIQNHIKANFKGRHINPCLTSTVSEIFFVDDSIEKGKCILLETVESERNLLKFINSNKKNIILLAVDGCFIGRGDKSPEHCDCIFFDDSTFCFAELKFESTTAKELSIKNNRLKAVNQLRSTFKVFDTAFAGNFLGLRLESYVCTPEHYPSKDSALNAFVIEFLEDFGMLLIESNEKTFA